MTDVTTLILREYQRIAGAFDELRPIEPVQNIYNPLAYAWKPWEAYVRRYVTTPKTVVFLGMNPGPWGMAQTGIPFGEIAAVRDWLGIVEPVGRPDKEHPKRPVEGFHCGKSEVSGRRLWGLMADRFTTPQRFFDRHVILNYCPLAFMADGGRNVTPDKIPSAMRRTVLRTCDEHLSRVLAILMPAYCVGIGTFAERRLHQAVGLLASGAPSIVRVLHPSPASPAANRDWAGTVTRQLSEAGVWP